MSRRELWSRLWLTISQKCLTPFFRPPFSVSLSLRSRIPIMALVDGDPSGLSILATYINGSTAMRHESDKLAAGKRIKWIGIQLSELSRWVGMPMLSDI